LPPEAAHARVNRSPFDTSTIRVLQDGSGNNSHTLTHRPMIWPRVVHLRPINLMILAGRVDLEESPDTATMQPQGSASV
jgi:hypothetical protein